jgi:hypothetical protein
MNVWPLLPMVIAVFEVDVGEVDKMPISGINEEMSGNELAG